MSDSNAFLTQLLSLQQDGNGAISGPSNWASSPPMLEIKTEIDPVIETLADSMLQAGGNGTARWHFFIGSPGNGKSAAVGKLCRSLVTERDCRVLADDDEQTQLQSLSPEAIPYELRVLEGESRYASGLVVQDASVVRNPYAPDADPATELLKTARLAWDKGMSLIACTNRGVLEKAVHEHYLDPEFKDLSWFKILRQVAEQSEVSLDGALDGPMAFSEGGRKAFKEVSVHYSYLENRSLLVASDSFEKLLLCAVDEQNWIPCVECRVCSFCPFKQNREWLHENEARKAFLDILQRAEAHSGQVIVFREALALLSLVLAGCPRDYIDSTPCEWVASRVSDGDFFALAVRRIYMALFAAHSRYGLEADRLLEKRQREGLEAILSLLPSEQHDARIALEKVLETDASPSTDVGIGRLLGTHGALAELAAWRECQAPDFLGRWDDELQVVTESENPLLSDIERNCLNAWLDMEACVESAPTHEANSAYWALRRWTSNFLMHLGTLAEGRSAWAEELDEFLLVLIAARKPKADQTREEKRRIRDLDRNLAELLAADVHQADNGGSVRLSTSAVLSGNWVSRNLHPRIAMEGTTPGPFLTVEFGNGEDVTRERATLSARAYCWLRRHATRRLHGVSFPPELLSGIADARVRAAAKGKYAFANDEVELVVTQPTGPPFVIERDRDGYVYVEEHD